MRLLEVLVYPKQVYHFCLSDCKSLIQQFSRLLHIQINTKIDVLWTAAFTRSVKWNLSLVHEMRQQQVQSYLTIV